jgi:hypothetical protein
LRVTGKTKLSVFIGISFLSLKTNFIVQNFWKDRKYYLYRWPQERESPRYSADYLQAIFPQ